LHRVREEFTECLMQDRDHMPRKTRHVTAG
jgi:hypothetical protein